MAPDATPQAEHETAPTTVTVSAAVPLPRLSSRPAAAPATTHTLPCARQQVLALIDTALVAAAASSPEDTGALLRFLQQAPHWTDVRVRTQLGSGAVRPGCQESQQPPGVPPWLSKQSKQQPWVPPWACRSATHRPATLTVLVL